MMNNSNSFDGIRYKKGSLSIVDQLRLPDELVYIPISTVDDAWKAIHTMSIDGASAIALSGVLSLAVELDQSRSKFDSLSAVKQFVTDQLNYLITARSSATILINNSKRIIHCLVEQAQQSSSINIFIDRLIDFIEHFLVEHLQINQNIAKNALNILQNKFTPQKRLIILTHGSAGSFGHLGFETALCVIRKLAENDLLHNVYFTETRPNNQGSRLTAYAFVHDRIPHTMICDSMVAHLMKTQSIHAVIVGAHSVMSNGDTVNKVGTYQLAILAHHHQIPFYIAASSNSIDLSKTASDKTVAEQRPSSEITSIRGINIAAEGVNVWNPMFDITPNQFITAFITEHGLTNVDELGDKLEQKESQTNGFQILQE